VLCVVAEVDDRQAVEVGHDKRAERGPPDLRSVRVTR
jgi:hypothetical protein